VPFGYSGGRVKKDGPLEPPLFGRWLPKPPTVPPSPHEASPRCTFLPRLELGRLELAYRFLNRHLLISRAAGPRVRLEEKEGRQSRSIDGGRAAKIAHVHCSCSVAMNPAIDLADPSLPGQSRVAMRGVRSEDAGPSA